MIKNRILCLVLAFFTCHFLVAQGKYYKEMKQLQTAIQKKIYDSSAGYYKDVVSSKPNDNPYSYLWPICAM